MKLCTAFYTDVNFDPDRVLPCCTGTENIPGLPFYGGPLDMAAYRNFVTRSLAALQEDASLCRGCVHLENREGTLTGDPGAQVLFHNVRINHHRNYCNCRCIYCPFWKKSPSQKIYAIRPVLESLMTQQALHPSCCMAWGGGEPTILPDFEETCLWLTASGYRQYVHTNALVHSAAIASMLRNNSGKVNISLDSFDRTSYKNIKGVDGWDKVLACINRYRSVCYDPDKLEIKYIIFDKTNSVRDVQHFFAVIKSLDIRHVQYAFHTNDVGMDTLSPRTLFSAAIFVRMAREAALTCHGFELPQSLRNNVERLSREL